MKQTVAVWKGVWVEDLYQLYWNRMTVVEDS